MSISWNLAFNCISLKNVKLLFMKRILISILVFVSFCAFVEAQVQIELPKWEKGFLDIHHINTGRGNCTFVVMPDGTTLMIDAGDFNSEAFDENYAPMFAPKVFPNSSYTAGNAIANYVMNLMGKKNARIDYFLLTHFHSDHYGSVTKNSEPSAKGPYLLTGLTEVGDIIPIKTYVDRDYPDYNFPTILAEITNGAGGVEKEAFANLMSFLGFQTKENGMKAERFNVGSKKQFVMRYDSKSFPEFEIRNIKAGNVLWTGTEGKTRTLFTKEQALGKDGKFNENMMSTAIVIGYGRFRYFSGGDNPGLVDQDRPQWSDMESPMAEVVGKVQAMSLDHHSNRDATNRNILEKLDPKVVVAQSWSTDHPGAEVGARLTSSNIGTRKRDIFMNLYNNETSVAIGPWFARNLKCKSGHIVIRVYKNGSYNVFVLDDTKSSLVVKEKFGLYNE